MIFRFCCNSLSDHIYLFLVVLLIFMVGRNNLSGHVYAFLVVMKCYPQHVNIKQFDHVNIITTFAGSIDASVYLSYASCNVVSTFRSQSKTRNPYARLRLRIRQKSRFKDIYGTDPYARIRVHLHVRMRFRCFQSPGVAICNADG